MAAMPHSRDGWAGHGSAPQPQPFTIQHSSKCLSAVAAQQPDGWGWEAYQPLDPHQSGHMTQFSVSAFW